MKAKKYIVGVLAAMAFVGGLASSVQAQIGTGWIPIIESSVAVTSGGGRIIPFPTAYPAGGALFIIPNPVGTAEYRYAPLPVTNTEQLQAELTVDSLGGNAVGLLQTGPGVLAVRKSPPSLFDMLYDAVSGKTLAPYVIGSTFQINTIYTPAAGTVDIYINQSKVEEIKVASVPVYNMVGVWSPVNLSVAAGGGPAEVTWREILFWKDGVK
ncbi:MAG: hypothetical protein ABSE59_04545 [Opitutaceae bacterium]|jgi:hypothetical protein